MKTKETLKTKAATETGEHFVKQDVGGKSVSHGNAGFYMSNLNETFELKMKKVFLLINPLHFLNRRGNRRLKVLNFGKFNCYKACLLHQVTFMEKNMMSRCATTKTKKNKKYF